ncbi:MAG TPA: hypothetical protein VK687_07330 [Bryobacteraceae bacterium]|nr:hypothetical protein [Bryobacteraceae bacterium]
MPNVLYAYENLREELRYIDGAIPYRIGRERERLIADLDKKKTELVP